MADKVSKKVRSRNMSAIKGKNTKPENDSQAFFTSQRLQVQIAQKGFTWQTRYHIGSL